MSGWVELGGSRSEVFFIEPYDFMSGAFAIWTRPLASNSHVSATSPQSADTAFRIPITSTGNGVASDVSAAATPVWSELASFPYPPAAFYPGGGRTNDRAKGVVVVILVLDPDQGDSGLSGRTTSLINPDDADQRLAVAIAHNRPHEFSHALSRVLDEYLDHDNIGLGIDNDLTGSSPTVANVVERSNCDELPWQHLLVGRVANPDVDHLIGAFGASAVGYHSELRCLMNGTHDNADFYGGDGRLRVYDRFCNICREITAFRILERTRVLADTSSSWATWISEYRMPFYDEFGLSVPSPVPQENNVGTPIFEACVP